MTNNDFFFNLQVLFAINVFIVAVYRTIDFLLFSYMKATSLIRYLFFINTIRRRYNKKKIQLILKDSKGIHWKIHHLISFVAKYYFYCFYSSKIINIKYLSLNGSSNLDLNKLFPFLTVRENETKCWKINEPN